MAPYATYEERLATLSSRPHAPPIPQPADLQLLLDPSKVPVGPNMSLRTYALSCPVRDVALNGWQKKPWR